MLAQAWCLVLRLVGLEQSQCYWQPRIGQQTAMKLNQVQLNCTGVGDCMCLGVCLGNRSTTPPFQHAAVAPFTALGT